MVRLVRLLIVFALVAACSTESAVTTVSITATVAVNTTTPSTTTPITTTLPSTPPTGTTTTVPRLDRSDNVTIGRIRADLDALLSGGPRVSGSPAEAAAIDYFGDVADKTSGGSVVVQSVPLPGGAESANSWVDVGDGDRWLLLGAHIDSVAGAPGADDNGSGVVLLLELLRRLIEDPPEGLRVTIVAFGAEERIGSSGHHFGSRYAVAEMGDDLPDYMVSVDMVGVAEELQVVDFRDSSATFADEVALVAADAGIAVVRLSRGEISDHVAFARAGVPATLLNRRDNPAWHTPQDNHVSDAAMLVVLDLIEAIVEHLTPESHDLDGGDEHHE